MRWLLLISLQIALASCSLFGKGVEDCAADYYNFMVGHSGKVAYSSFLSPAYRGSLKPGARETYDKAMTLSQRGSDRFPYVEQDDVIVVQDGRFAITTMRDGLDSAFSSMAPVRWVKDGQRWYLYLGMDIELGKYGVFPVTLTITSTAQEDSDAVTESTSSDADAEKL